MSDEQDQERDESAESLLDRLRDEAARIMARTSDEAIKQQIAQELQMLCQMISSRDHNLDSIKGRLVANAPLRWAAYLRNPQRAELRAGIDRLPDSGKSVGDQWQELCLWVTIKAQQIIRETDDRELKGLVAAQLDVLIHEYPRPRNANDLRIRVYMFKKTIERWAKARIRSIVPNAAAWPEPEG
jgi:hypothetical protein